MFADPTPSESVRVGVIGAGQLAHMMGEAAAAVGVTVTVLATSLEDSAVSTCDATLIGSSYDFDALRGLAKDVAVVTFDHELVDLDQIEALEHAGIVVRPSATALRFAVDKAHQRQAFAAAGLPVPRFLLLKQPDGRAVDVFLDELDSLPILKTARGGYDGRGVFFFTTRHELDEAIARLTLNGTVVLEERLTLLSEVAQVVARDVTGTVVLYPLVTTVQRDGMCVEVRYPSTLDPALHDEATRLTHRVADVVGGVGVMAIEYFATPEGLIINEVALRPHNSGHWTIEGCSSSQFAQHLRAVSGQPLSDIAINRSFAVMVNVVGDVQPGSLDAARAVEDVFVHDYAKTWRPGRKLGHVTALGDDAEGAHVRAWTSARAYGTGTREA